MALEATIGWSSYGIHISNSFLPSHLIPSFQIHNLFNLGYFDSFFSSSHYAQQHRKIRRFEDRKCLRTYYSHFISYVSVSGCPVPHCRRQSVTQENSGNIHQCPFGLSVFRMHPGRGHAFGRAHVCVTVWLCVGGSNIYILLCGLCIRYEFCISI